MPETFDCLAARYHAPYAVLDVLREDLWKDDARHGDPRDFKQSLPPVFTFHKELSIHIEGERRII